MSTDDKRSLQERLQKASTAFNSGDPLRVKELLLEAADALSSPSSTRPIDMLLFCPRCDKQHIDEAEPEKGWTNPPHATHTCKFCGLNWRPSNALTNGASGLTVLEDKHVERMQACVPARVSATLPPTLAEEGTEGWLPWCLDSRAWCAKVDALSVEPERKDIK